MMTSYSVHLDKTDSQTATVNELPENNSFALNVYINHVNSLTFFADSLDRLLDLGYAIVNAANRIDPAYNDALQHGEEKSTGTGFAINDAVQHAETERQEACHPD